MNVARFLNRPSTIWTVTDSEETDELGNLIENEPTATSELCYFAPRGAGSAGTTGAASEQNVDRSTTVDEWVYIVRAAAALTSVDRVEIDGESGMFEVFGEPTHEWNPLTAEPSHLTARLRRTQR